MDYFRGAYRPLFEQLGNLALSEPSQFIGREPAKIALDWRETPQAHIFEADLPGLKKDDVKLEIQNGVMEIVGKPSEEISETDEGATWHAMERTANLTKSALVRRIGLPEDANTEGVKASLNNGVLTVTFPKKDVRKHVKKVEIEEVNKEGIAHKLVKSLKGIVAPVKGK